MRESDFAAAMASVTSRSNVSGAGPPGGLAQCAAHRVARQLLDQFALGRDHQRRAARHDRNGGMQRGENEPEDQQQQDQMQDLADPLKNSPDQPEKSPQSGPDTHSSLQPAPRTITDAQIFSSMRAALPDKSRR